MTSSKQKSGSPKASSFGSVIARPALVSLLLAVSTFAVYWPVLRCDFINYDDTAYVTANPHVQHGFTPEGVVWALGTVHMGSWHPLTWLSHMLDWQLFGASAAGPHFTNLLFHIANTVLLFIVLRQFTGALWRSAFVAALFALHPLHVESVAWVSERKDVLSTFFVFLALGAYGRYARKMSRVEGRGSRADRPVPALDTRRWTLDYALALLFFTLGLMSKPMVVTLPFVLLLLDYWPLYRVSGARCQGPGAGCEGSGAGRVSNIPGLVWEKRLFFALSAIFCAVTFWAQRMAGAMELAKLSLPDRIENAFVSYARYLGKTFWPVNLAVLYPHPGHRPFVPALLAVVLVIGLCLGALRLGRKFPFVITGWFWFLGTLIPVIGLVQAGNQAMADRYTYVPLIGLFVILAWGVGEALTRSRLSRVGGTAAGVAAGLALVACAGRTSDQLRFWQNSGTLFRHALAVTKNNHVAYNNLGAYLYDQGRPDEAQDNYLAALQIDPDDASAHNNLGTVLVAQGRDDEAITHYQRALQINPNNAEAHNNLGAVLARAGRIEEAIVHYQKALQIDPDFVGAHANLGVALVRKGLFYEAAAHYRTVLRMNPNNAEALNSLGTVLAMQEKFDEAIVCFRAALKVAPNSTSAHNNLGGALEEKGLLDEAANDYKEALRLNPDSPVAHVNLGRVLARLGRRDEAVAEFNEALRLKPDYAEAKQQLRALAPEKSSQ